MWVKKYAPKNLSQFVGNAEMKAAFVVWAKKWKPGKAALLYGPPGVGKTTIAELVSAELGYDLIEMNASDLRNKAGIASVLGAASAQKSLFAKGKLLLADEVDGVAGRRDRGGVSELVATIKSSTFPVVLTANDVVVSDAASYGKYVDRYVAQKTSQNKFAVFQFLKKAAAEEGRTPNEKWIWRIVYTHIAEIEKNGRLGIEACLKELLGGGSDWWSWNSKLAPLRPVCDLFAFTRPGVGEIAGHLKRICGEEGIEASSSALELIASKSGGDIRAAVNSLQALAEGRKSLPEEFQLDERDSRKNVSEALRIIFKTKDFSTARTTLSRLHLEPSELEGWLGYNMPLEYSGGDLAAGFDTLSKADVFAGRIRRRNDWKLRKYQMDLLAGIASAKRDKSAFSGTYASPLERLSGASRVKRRLRRQIAAKLSPIVHAPRRVVQQDYLWLLPIILEKDKSLGVSLKLDDEELEFLGVAAEKGKAKGRSVRGAAAPKGGRRGKAA